MLVSGAVLAVFGSHANAQTVLFADNFDRANNNFISAASTGMSGTLGPLTYLEPWQGVPYNEAVLRIENNRLGKLAAGMGMGGLNHNFIDASILSAGGFSLSFDVVSAGTTGDDRHDRFGGFGVGLTLAEINAFQDENDTDFGPRGTIDPTGAPGGIHPGVADFYVSLSIDNLVQVFSAGALVGEFAVTPAGSKTIWTDFSFANFNAGSQVDYLVKFEGNPVTTGSFNWSNTGENYVGFSMRANQVIVDNLSIATVVPEPSVAALGLLGAGFATWVRSRRKA